MSTAEVNADELHDAMQLLALASEVLLMREPQIGNGALMDRLRADHPHEFAIVFEGEQHGPGEHAA